MSQLRAVAEGKSILSPVLMAREYRAALIAVHPSQKHPEGIASFNPALTDEIRLRWVVNHKLKSTLKELSKMAATRCGRSAAFTPLQRTMFHARRIFPELHDYGR